MACPGGEMHRVPPTHILVRQTFLTSAGRAHKSASTSPNKAFSSDLMPSSMRRRCRASASFRTNARSRPWSPLTSVSRRSNPPSSFAKGPLRPSRIATRNRRLISSFSASSVKSFRAFASRPSEKYSRKITAPVGAHLRRTSKELRRTTMTDWTLYCRCRMGEGGMGAANSNGACMGHGRWPAQQDARGARGSVQRGGRSAHRIVYMLTTR